MTAIRSNTKYLVAAVFGGVLLVVVASWLLLVSPQRSKANRLDRDIASVQQQIDERQAALASPKANIHVRASDVFRLTRAMPDTTDMSGIIVALNHLAGAHHLGFNSIQPSPLVAQTGFNVQPVSVELEGRFADVDKFLGGVRKLVRIQNHRLAVTGRLFSVDSVELAQPTAHEKTFPNVKATLTIDAFMFAGGALNASPQPTSSGSSDTVAAGAK